MKKTIAYLIIIFVAMTGMSTAHPDFRNVNITVPGTLKDTFIIESMIDNYITLIKGARKMTKVMMGEPQDTFPSLKGREAFVEMINSLKQKLEEKSGTLKDITHLKITGMLNEDDYRVLKYMGGSYIEKEANDFEKVLHSWANLESLDISDTRTSTSSGEMPLYAFSYCDMIKTLILPKDQMIFNALVIEFCSNLEFLTLPEKLDNIVNLDFSLLEKLNTLKISENNPIYSTRDGILYNKDKSAILRYPPGKSQKEFNIPDGVTEIGSRAFGSCSNLVSVRIPNTVTVIGGFAFEGCENLTEINIPENVTEITIGLFENCVALKGIKLPDGLAKISSGGFEGCSSLNEILIPDSVENIEYLAFTHCDDLARITIGKKVTSIGVSAFGYCKNLKSVSLRNPDPPKIDGSAFMKEILRKCILTVPMRSMAAYKNAEVWKNFKNVVETE